MRQRDAAARIEQEMSHRSRRSRHREATVTVERVAAEQLREQQKAVPRDRLVQAEKLAAVGRAWQPPSRTRSNNPLEAVTNLLYLVRTDHDALPRVERLPGSG